VIHPRLRAVAFDYGGTLVSFRRPVASLDRLDPELARLLLPVRGGGAAPRGLARALDARVESAAGPSGEGSDPAREVDIARVYDAALLELVGHRVPSRTRSRVVWLHQRAWFAGVTVRPGAVRLLEAIRGHGLRTGLCSNAPYPPAVLRAQLRHLGLLAHLDVTVFSSQVGWRKPHPAIFAALLRRLRLAPGAVLFVGDSPAADLAGARAAGMRARLAPAGRAPLWSALLCEVAALGERS